MLEGIGAGLSSLNAALALAKALNSANTQAAINDIKLGLQERIFEAREALDSARETQAASLSRIRELEQEIVQLKDWEAEKQRYELHEVGDGAFVYSLKESVKGSQPDPWLCANCYHQGRKSILQRVGRSSMIVASVGLPTEYACAACQAKVFE